MILSRSMSWVLKGWSCVELTKSHFSHLEIPTFSALSFGSWSNNVWCCINYSMQVGFGIINMAEFRINSNLILQNFGRPIRRPYDSFQMAILANSNHVPFWSKCWHLQHVMWPYGRYKGGVYKKESTYVCVCSFVSSWAWESDVFVTPFVNHEAANCKKEREN